VASAGALVGTVVVRRNSPQGFTRQEENVLDRLARMTGAALDALTRRGALAGDGDVEVVTGLGTHERLVTDLRSALRTRVDHDMPVMLIVAELDGLARVRSEIGIEVGHQMLKELSATLASALRVGDIAYCTDEDRFAVLLPATGIFDARAAASRLSTTVETVARQRFSTAGPVRLRTAVLGVEGTAEEVLTEAGRVLSVDRRY
jgi:GGDEF domain-containing protein